MKTVEVPLTSDPQTITIVTGADENYAIGLAVTLRSAIDHLGPDRKLDVYVIDGGILEETRLKLLASWNDPRVTISWKNPKLDSLDGFVTTDYLNRSTYLRLLIPEIVPESTTKVIYLDSDLLITQDLGLLWDEPIDDFAILAGQEVGAPYVDAAIVFADDSKKYSRVGITTPIKNYRELGMDPYAKVFNAGILVVNVAKWRAMDVPGLAHKCLIDHREHVLFCDQYALNVVLANDWREIDSRWNLTASFFEYSSVLNSPFSSTVYDELASGAWILHFTGKLKPWHDNFALPIGLDYFSSLDSTAWRGLRPAWTNSNKPTRPERSNSTSDATFSILSIPQKTKRTWGAWWVKRKFKFRSRFAKSSPAVSSSKETYLKAS